PRGVGGGQAAPFVERPVRETSRVQPGQGIECRGHGRGGGDGDRTGARSRTGTAPAREGRARTCSRAEGDGGTGLEGGAAPRTTIDAGGRGSHSAGARAHLHDGEGRG